MECLLYVMTGTVDAMYSLHAKSQSSAVPQSASSSAATVPALCSCKLQLALCTLEPLNSSMMVAGTNAKFCCWAMQLDPNSEVAWGAFLW